MDLILEIYTPGNGKRYEFQADDALTVEDAAALAAEEINLFENGDLAPAGGARLFHPRTRRALPEALTLAAAGIGSGDTLLLL